MATNIVTTIKPMLGGADASAGTGGVANVIVGGSGAWANGETFLIVLNRALTDLVTSLGAGPVTGKVPTFFLTYGKKLNLLFDTTWAFSAVSNPLVINDPNALGNGSVSLGDAYSEAQNTVAMAPFQGKIAIFGTDHIQIWQVAADPANYQLLQVLENIGAIAKLSVKSFGELDVFFLHTTGVRSLRVRDASSNGMSIDIGSPIDSLIQSQIVAASATERAAACGVIDTTNSQYWLFLKDTIYVLSHFPSAKISAWSVWKPTYQSAAYASVSFVNSVPTSVLVKVGMTSDAAQAFYSVTVGGSGTTQLPPGVYIFVYAVASDTLVGTHQPTGGLDFAGRIQFTIGLTFVETNNQTSFIPEKFVTYNGQVFASSADAFFVYGGADRNTYDNSICAMETSWLDFDAPAIEKVFHGVDVAQDGSWNHYASPDYLSQTMQEIMRAESNPTFAGGKIGWSNSGTHMKYRLQTTGVAERSVISNLLVHYKETAQR